MKTFAGIVAVAVITFGAVGVSLPCSDLFLTKGDYRISARNMDFDKEMYPMLVVSPRGVTRRSYFPLEGDVPLVWTARYGSVAIYSFMLDDSDDGINEAGLSAAMQWLEGMHYPTGQSDRALSYNYALQYYLDNCATVAEVVEAAPTIKVYPILTDVVPEAPQHFIFHDATGDSAVLEYDETGNLNIYRSTDIYVGVTTNEPFYPEQIDNLQHYQPWADPPNLPGDNDSTDRFVRGAYMLDRMPTPASLGLALGYTWMFIQNIAHPSTSAPSGKPNESQTIWTSVRNHLEPSYYFRTLDKPGIRWVDFDDLDFTEGQSMKGQLLSSSDGGDVSGNFLAIDAGADCRISLKGLSINPAALKSGQACSYLLYLGQDITQRFDLYVLAKVGDRYYTLNNDGTLRAGIHKVYKNVARAKAPIMLEIPFDYVIPSGLAGQKITFCIAAVAAGKTPNPANAIMMDVEPMTVK